MTYTKTTVTIFTTEDGQEFKTEGEAKRHTAFIELANKIGFSDISAIRDAIKDEKNRTLIREMLDSYNDPSKPEAEGWIEWSSEELPVDGNTRVDVKFGNGEIDYNSRANMWAWGYDDGTEINPRHIVAYRIHNGEKV